MINYRSKAPFRYVTDFRKLGKLVLKNPKSFNLSREVFKSNKPFKLRELSITCDTLKDFYDPGLRYYHHRNFLKKMSRLKSLELRRANIGLAENIRMLDKLKSLKVLKLIGVGVTLQEIYTIKDKAFNELELDEHVNELKYLGRRYRYLRPDQAGRATLISRSSRSKYYTYLRYKSLVLHPVEQNHYHQALIPFQNKGYFGKPKFEFKRRFNYNGQYADWGEYYGANRLNTEWVYNHFKDTSRFKYMGSLKTGEKDEYFYSLAYRTYDDYCNLFDFYKWDTTSFQDRQSNLNYSNGELLPIQWKKRRKNTYFKGSRIKKIIKENHSNYTLERLDEKNLFELKAIRKNNYKNKSTLEYQRNNNYSELRYFQKYAFSFKDYSAKTRRLLRSNILDAWFEYDDNTHVYLLKLKTIDKVYSNEVEWWNRNGDVLKNGFRSVFLKYEAALLKKFNKMDLKSKRNKERLMRKYHFHPSFKGFVDFTNYRYKDYSRHKNINRMDWSHIHLLSDRELNMTSKYWLSQKENCIRNEKEIILNATPLQVSINEVLRTTDYKRLSLFKWKENYDSINLIETGFRSEDLYDFHGCKMYVIDSEKKIFTTFNLSQESGRFVNNAGIGYVYYLPTGSMQHQTIVIERGHALYIAKKVLFSNNNVLTFEKIPNELINYKIIFKMFN